MGTAGPTGVIHATQQLLRRDEPTGGPTGGQGPL